jgi:soluble lytic murein transglycosylase-like protein
MKVFTRTGVLVFALVGTTLMVGMLALSLVGEYFYQPQLKAIHEMAELTKVQRAKLMHVNLRNRQLMTLVKVRQYLSEHRIDMPPGEVWNIATTIDRVGSKYRIEPEMLLAIIHTESAFRSDAVSSKGAVGLMQLLPSTAEEVAREIDLEWTGEEVLRDPEVNIELGSYYLSKLRDRFDSMEAAVVAYNEGPGRVEQLQQARIAFPTFYRDRVFGSLRQVSY